MQATPFRTSHRGQRSRRAVRAARLLALAGLLALLLIPLSATLRQGATAVPPEPLAAPPLAQFAPLLDEPESLETPEEWIAPQPDAAVAEQGSPTLARREPEPPIPQPRPTRAPLAGRSPEGLSLHVLRYVPLIVEIGGEVGVDPAVLAALMEVEGSGEDAVSWAGAQGLMQVMPDKLHTGDDPFDPPTNVRRAAQFVRHLATTWEGDLAAVAGSYFGAVDNQGFVTEASDGIATGTQYVSRFAAAYERWASALGQPVRPVVMRTRPRAPIARHTVQPGDSARGLAERYGISIATLAAANELANPNLLLVGQELRIPTVDGVLHTLQPDESLARVAERYGVPASSLLEANRLAAEPPTGALLVVPGVTPTWTPVVPPGTPAPAPPAPALTWRTVFEERFATNGRGWRHSQNGTGSFADGAYRLFGRDPGRFVAIGAPLEQTFRDVTVKGTFRKAAGPPGGGYGLILRDQGPDSRDGLSQGGRYYVFEAGDKGEFGIWRRDVTRWVELIPWTPSPAIRPDRGRNELAVEAVGPRFTFLINDTQVASIHDAVLAEGSVGIYLGGDSNVVIAEHLLVQVAD